MSDEMSHPVTRGELRAELASYPTKADLRAELASYATKAELREEFPTKQYVDDMARTFVAALERLDSKIDRVALDLMRHMNSLIESVRVDIRAITEPYQDHGPRISRLERAVFPDDGGAVKAKARVRRRTRPR